MSSNEEQRSYWNDKAGETWARYDEPLNRQIAPLGEAGIQQLAPRAGERLIDIGCGAGNTTLAIAARVAPTGYVLGADISAPLLQLARSRPLPPGAQVEFAQLDAQADDLLAAAGGQPLDAAYSRFGVMFFSDPVAAFSNIRRALATHGRLVFVCWRSLAENDWMRKPLEAALPVLPPMPPTDPLAPGPFAFADDARVASLLRAGGFRSVSHRRIDRSIGSGDLAGSLELLCRIGPLGAALREHPGLLPAVRNKLRAALAPYEGPQGVLMPAAAWVVSAAV